MDGGKLLAQTRHDFLRVVETQRGLRQERKLLRIFDFQRVHGGDGIHHDGAVRSFAGSADNFLMVLVTDQNDGALFAGEFQGFEMDFGH